MGADLGGCFGCLGCQCLYLAGDHGKALASFPSPSGLDGGIQRQQIGAGRDVRTQADHVANTVGRLCQPRHFLIGGGRAIPGLVHRLAHTADLPTDFSDTSGHFLGGGGDRVEVARGGRGSRRCHGCTVHVFAVQTPTCLWRLCANPHPTASGRSSSRRWTGRNPGHSGRSPPGSDLHTYSPSLAASPDNGSLMRRIIRPNGCQIINRAPDRGRGPSGPAPPPR